MNEEKLKVETAPASPAPVHVETHPIVEVEPLPQYGIEETDIDYGKLLSKFQDKAKFIQGIKKVAVNQTYPTDWLGRKGKDENIIYNLMGPGAERIKSICPIGFLRIRSREELWNKESGPGYTVYYEADVYCGNKGSGALPVLGSCSSDDDFFSTETETLPYNPDNPEQKAAIESGEGTPSNDKKTIYIRRRMPAAEVTKENIVKSALTNLIVNGVTRVLGLRQMTGEALKEYGVDISKIPSFSYGSKRAESGRLSPAAEEKRAAIWKMLCELNGENEEAAGKSLQGHTAFKDFPGVTDVKKLSEAQINIAYGKIKHVYDAWRGEVAAKEEAAGKKGSKDDLFKK
jgi:hypothetical protein